jgi:hypothetical protein
MGVLDVFSLAIRAILIVEVLFLILIVAAIPGVLAEKRHSPWAEVIKSMRPRVGNGVAVLAVHGETQGNADNGWFCLQLKDLRHGLLSPGGATAAFVLLGLLFANKLLGSPEHWEVASGVESAINGRQPAYQEVIDTELLDDCFLVTLAENVAVDHPGSRSAADRALDDVHGLSPQRWRGRTLRPLHLRVD